MEKLPYNSRLFFISIGFVSFFVFFKLVSSPVITQLSVSEVGSRFNEASAPRWITVCGEREREREMRQASSVYRVALNVGLQSKSLKNAL